MAPRRVVVGVGVLAAILSMARHLPVLDEPFARNLEGFNGALNIGWSARCYDLFGFRRLAGRPFLGVLPSDQIRGQPYLNHPPLVPWGTYGTTRLLGMSVRSIRVLPVLCSALAAFMLTLFAGIAVSTRAAWVVLLLFDSVPGVFAYGSMANYESPLLALCVLAFMLEPLRDAGRARFVLAAAVLAVAVWTDWVGCFLLPALALAARLSGRYPIRLRRVAALLGVVVGAVAAYVVLVAWWLGSAAEAVARVVESARITQTHGLTFAEWGTAQVAHVGQVLTWPVAVIGVVGVIAGCVRCVRRQARAGELVVSSVVVGALSVVAFSGRSVSHTYWVYPLVPAFVVGTSLLVELCWERLPHQVARGLAVVVLVALPGWAGWRCVAYHRGVDYGGTHPEADAINAFYDADTMLIVPSDGPNEVSTLVADVRAWVVPMTLDSIAAASLPIAEFQRGEGSLRRLVVAVPRGAVADHPQLAADLQRNGFRPLARGLWTVFELSR